MYSYTLYTVTPFCTTEATDSDIPLRHTHAWMLPRHPFTQSPTPDVQSNPCLVSPNYAMTHSNPTSESAAHLYTYKVYKVCAVRPKNFPFMLLFHNLPASQPNSSTIYRRRRQKWREPLVCSISTFDAWKQRCLPCKPCQPYHRRGYAANSAYWRPPPPPPYHLAPSMVCLCGNQAIYITLWHTPGYQTSIWP